ncbi:MAG: hypothetical protein J0I21_08890 [Alphaproteobacteria bacterium]|nr:hypothetical protein [Alphaproteobacteria bacterium]
MVTVGASDFCRNFGHYRLLSERETVRICVAGDVVGYFLGPADFERAKRLLEHDRQVPSAQVSSAPVPLPRNTS